MSESLGLDAMYTTWVNALRRWERQHGGHYVIHNVRFCDPDHDPHLASCFLSGPESAEAPIVEWHIKEIQANMPGGEGSMDGLIDVRMQDAFWEAPTHA